MNMKVKENNQPRFSNPRRHYRDDFLHIWANRSDDDEPKYGAKNSNSPLRFEGPSVYSYATCIAYRAKDKDGNDLYVVSEENYSVTTSKHIGDVRRAIPSWATVFYVPVRVTEYHHGLTGYSRGCYSPVSSVNDRIPTQTAKDVKRWFEYHLDAILENIAKARMQKTRDNQTWMYNSLASKYLAWCRANGLKFKRSYLDVSERIPGAKEALARQKAKEAKETARKEKIAKDGLNMIRAAFGKMTDQPMEDYILRAFQVQSLDSIMGQLYLDLTGKMTPTEVGPLLRGHIHSHFGNMARVCGSWVFTDLSARVPIHDARELVQLVLKVYDRGLPFRPESRVSVGGYSLNHIDSEGTVTVGCHKFRRPMVEAMARQLGLLARGDD